MASENNKRIAKNTVLLYIRMFFSIIVGLYTSRVVLGTLGVDDYGVYNVVGGVVAMLGFLNSAMTAASLLDLCLNPCRYRLNYPCAGGDDWLMVPES